ncbi:MAG: hypothetical protein IJ038_05185 [Clostridia bacterium]|nr:hypothetical protein [Clostridia bacterium]
MTQDKLSVERERSARRYLTLYGDAERVGVDISTPLGAGEPFQIWWARTVKDRDVPYHLTYHEFNKLSDRDGCATVYGRTVWGTWCKLTCAYWRVVACSVLCGAELREAKLYMKEIMGE